MNDQRPTNKTRRYLYLIKEPVSPSLKFLLSLLIIETSFIVYLLYGEILVMYLSVPLVVLGWWFANWFYGIYKIGITQNLDARLTAINNGNAREVYYVFKKEIDRAGEIETKIHRNYTRKRRSGEWFALYFWQIAWIWMRYFR